MHLCAFLFYGGFRQSPGERRVVAQGERRAWQQHQLQESALQHLCQGKNMNPSSKSTLSSRLQAPLCDNLSCTATFSCSFNLRPNPTPNPACPFRLPLHLQPEHPNVFFLPFCTSMKTFLVGKSRISQIISEGRKRAHRRSLSAEQSTTNRKES